jgi:hypothetical protein
MLLPPQIFLYCTIQKYHSGISAQTMSRAQPITPKQKKSRLKIGSPSFGVWRDCSHTFQSTATLPSVKEMQFSTLSSPLLCDMIEILQAAICSSFTENLLLKTHV